MAEVSNDIKEAVKQVYLADVEAIRNLSEIAGKINAGTFVFPGNLNVTGTIKSQSLDSLNSKIDSVNSSLTSSINNSINSVNSNLTNQVNSINSQLSTKISNNSNISLESNLNSSFLLSHAHHGSGVVTSAVPNFQMPFGPNIIFNRKWKISNA